MHIDWIHTYLDILNTRNFNQTAENLGLTQSTVSHRIQKLEEALGQKLFVRGRSGASPTPAGNKFEHYARNLQFEWAMAKRGLSTHPSNETEFRLGIQFDVAKCFMANLSNALRTALPKMRLYTEIDNSAQMRQDVLLGNLDAALIYTPDNSTDLYVKEITQMRYEMVSARPLELSEITEANYIYPNYSQRFSDQHRADLPKLTHCAHTSGQADAIAQLIKTSDGCSYLPSPIIADTTFYRVPNAPEFLQNVYFGCHVKNRLRADFVKAEQAMKNVFSVPKNEFDTA